MPRLERPAERQGLALYAGFSQHIEDQIGLEHVAPAFAGVERELLVLAPMQKATDRVDIGAREHDFFNR